MLSLKPNCLLTLTVAALAIGLVPNDVLAQKIVPGHTAYVHPDPWGARIRENQGVLRWQENNPSIRWWGLFKNSGSLGINVLVRGNAESIAGLKIRVGDQERMPTSTRSEQEFTLVDFGQIELKLDHPSHQLIELVRGSGEAMDIRELRLDGPASQDAFFNLKERRMQLRFT